jgi:hypothetical protein
MKTLLPLALLLLSLAANAWLLLARRSETAAAATPTPRPSTAPAAASAGARSAEAIQQARAAAAPPVPFVWRAPGPADADLRALVSDLRAAGFPDAVIVKFLGPLLRERTHAALAARPFWQQMGNSPEFRRLQLAAGDELLRRQEEILGPAGTRVATLDPVQRRLQYGDLSDASVAAILRIDRDYQAMAADRMFLGGGVVSAEEVRSRNEQLDTIERERWADLRAALSPADFAAYERRASAAARVVMLGLRNLTVSEEEYGRLLALQQATSPGAGSPFTLDFTAAVSLEKLDAQQAGLRAVLGAERTHTYLRAADFTYDQTARFAERHPALTTDTIAALHRLQVEARNMNQSLRPSTVPDPRALETARKSMAELNTRLEQLVGPEIAKDFRSQPAGSFFTSFRSAPPATPAVPPKN